MSSRSCGSRSRRVSYRYNLPHVVDLNLLAGIAAWVVVERDVGRVQ
jgi:energy-coupling factor transporter transmembrane protein EcfT